MDHVFAKGLQLFESNLVEAAKMPRTAIIPVVRDKETGFLNAGTYSGGVTSLEPLHILFGPKSQGAMEQFEGCDEFCAAVPRREQVDAMWITALALPQGICEIDVAGWHELPSRTIRTPGILECPLNLECRKIFSARLPRPWRTIVIGEVTGASLDTEMLGRSRSEVVRLYPMHEAGSHPATRLYGPSVLSGELLPGAEPGRPGPLAAGADGKTRVSGAELHAPGNDGVLMNAVWPRPSYFVLSTDEKGLTHALAVAGGSLQSTEPAVQVPVPKDSPTCRNVRRTGVFAVSIPDRALIAQFEQLEKSGTGDPASAGFTLLEPNAVDVRGIAECPVSMDCKSVLFEDVPGTDYAILIGRRVGLSLRRSIAERVDRDVADAETLAFTNGLYSSFLYAVMDRGMKRKWGFHDAENLSVRPLPSWGNRHTGGWWGPGPALNYWLMELTDEGLIDKADYYRIGRAVSLWADGRGVAHLAEYLTAAKRDELRGRLTTLFRMMAWAHRDQDKWHEVREYLRGFPPVLRSHHSGPLFHEDWSGRGVR